MADAKVTPTPMATADTTVLAPMMTGESGKSAPRAENMACRPKATSTPSPSPTKVETRPTTTASHTTDWVICRPLAPSARSSPSSRIRWPTMMVKVL